MFPGHLIRSIRKVIRHTRRSEKGARATYTATAAAVAFLSRAFFLFNSFSPQFFFAQTACKDETERARFPAVDSQQSHFVIRTVVCIRRKQTNKTRRCVNGEIILFHWVFVRNKGGGGRETTTDQREEKNTSLSATKRLRARRACEKDIFETITENYFVHYNIWNLSNQIKLKVVPIAQPRRFENVFFPGPTIWVLIEWGGEGGGCIFNYIWFYKFQMLRDNFPLRLICSFEDCQHLRSSLYRNRKNYFYISTTMLTSSLNCLIFFLLLITFHGSPTVLIIPSPSRRVTPKHTCVIRGEGRVLGFDVFNANEII